MNITKLAKRILADLSESEMRVAEMRVALEDLEDSIASLRMSLEAAAPEKNELIQTHINNLERALRLENRMKAYLEEVAKFLVADNEPR